MSMGDSVVDSARIKRGIVKKRTMRLDLSLILQIALVGNNYNGEEILILHLVRQCCFHHRQKD
jgi:hypothetical protein